MMPELRNRECSVNIPAFTLQAIAMHAPHRSPDRYTGGGV